MIAVYQSDTRVTVTVDGTTIAIARRCLHGIWICRVVASVELPDVATTEDGALRWAALLVATAATVEPDPIPRAVASA